MKPEVTGERAQLLKGKPFADAIKAEVADQVKTLTADHGIQPGLVVVRVGEDPASKIYVGKKVADSRELGIRSEQIHLPEETTGQQLAGLIRRLNEDDATDGILVQLPLPDHIDADAILDLIDPEKDVDGFHPVNVGRLQQKRSSLVPCTPAGVMEMLDRADVDVSGMNAVIVGRSNIVGKPMAMLLLHRNATVTVCHSRTRDLPEVCSRADILVAAIGRPAFITREYIKPGAIVIDVGINRIGDRDEVAELFPEDQVAKRMRAIDKRGSTIVGDVNPKHALENAGMFTPVPGGVGLLTVAMLMQNTVLAARARRLGASEAEK